MSNDDFEKGLNLLLNKAYNVPTPAEEFRCKLLNDLKERQRAHAGIRRSRIITLYSSFSAVAAVILFAFIPNVNFFANSEAESTITPVSESPATIQISPVAQKSVTPTNKPITTTPIQVTTQTVAYTGKSSFIPASAMAINSVDVFNPNTNKWTTVEKGSNFSIYDGTQIRTPLGATQSVNFSINEGPSVMLDGMSQVAINKNVLTIEDGRAVVSVNPTHKPMTLQLDKQDINMQPGSMIFATLDNDSSYTSNGIPAPMLVLLKGDATTANGHDTELTQGRVYELFDTGTGRYPSRKVGSYENKRQFMPMIDAVQAAYKSAQ